MKKVLTLILTVVLGIACVFGLTACNKQDKGTLVLGFDAEFPPYGYYDAESKSYKGFDIDLAKKVCSELGYKLELNPINWDLKDSLLDSGTIDFIWNGFTYEGRENDYTWSDKYISSNIVVLTTKSSNINTLSDLAGKVVAVQTESSGETAINDDNQAALKDSFASLQTVSDYNTAKTQMIAGAYDAIIIDVGVAKKYVKQNSNLKILDEIIVAENYAVGFKKGNTKLANEINAKLKEVAKNTKFIKSLCEKYDIEYDSFLLGK